MHEEKGSPRWVLELKRVGYEFGHCDGWRGNPRCVYKERKDGQKQGEGAEKSLIPASCFLSTCMAKSKESIVSRFYAMLDS